MVVLYRGLGGARWPFRFSLERSAHECGTRI